MSIPLRAAALDQGSSASLRLLAILRLRFHADGRAVGIPNRGRSRYESAEQFRRSAHVRPDIRAPWLRLEVAVALQKTRRPSRGDQGARPAALPPALRQGRSSFAVARQYPSSPPHVALLQER